MARRVPRLGVAQVWECVKCDFRYEAPIPCRMVFCPNHLGKLRMKLVAGPQPEPMPPKPPPPLHKPKLEPKTTEPRPGVRYVKRKVLRDR